MTLRPFPKAAHRTTRVCSTRPLLAWCGLALLWVLSACARDDDGLRAFRAALASRPGVAPRLSLASGFRPCTERVPAAGTIPVADCPASRRAARRRTRLPALDATTDARSAQLLALVDMVANDPRGIALDRSISKLRRAAELTGDSAPVLSDLAAALIVRAERTQAPRDLLEAYEVAEQAVARDPRNPAALYNRALAIDRFGLVDEGVAAWQAYLAADSTSGWAAEARRRLRLIRGTPAPLRPPSTDAPAATYEAYAAGEPQGARELGMEQLLAEWGEAVEAGAAGRANAALRAAEALGSALERRPGGDRSLADAVRAIRGAAGDSAATRELASAHREYGAGMRLFLAAAYEDAGPPFARALASRSPALQGWARVYGATDYAYLHAPDSAVQVLATTVESLDTVRYPAMAARALWPLANVRERAERWETGLDDARRSARLFARLGERENEGAALTNQADARFVLGEPDAGYATVHRAIQLLRPYRGSLRLHNLLAATADQVALDGLPRSAVLLANEDVRVGTRRGGNAAPEARLRRARYLAALGDTRRARLEVEAARPLVAAITAPRMQGWFRADLQESEAAATLRDDPERRTRALDSAAAFFARLPFRLLPQLVGAAEARLAASDPADAAARLERVMRLLEHRRDSLGMEPHRAAVFDAARGVVDRLVMLKLAQGRVAEALRYMDRARASLAPAGRASPSPPGGAVHARPGEVALEYALVGDTLLVWTVTDRRVQLSRTLIDTLRFVRTLETVEARLEAGGGEAAVRPALSLLYEWLVRPVEPELGGPETPLVFVADGSLSAVPFAALHDSRRGRYLVEDHPLRFAVSLAEAAKAPRASSGGSALFVANPAFSRHANPLLEPLEHAGEEVRRLGGAYPERTVLEGRAATRRALAAALPRAAVAHFAGHAVFDDARPERSYLVLAPAAGDSSGRVTAAELGRLDLRAVRLVVLSACRTVRGGRSRAAGYTGLSGALLAAGAGGVVGSTWDVDDQSTARLMSAFHPEFQRSHDGARALRAAQLTLLHSGDPALRTPAAWAGFRYAGG